MTVWVGTHDGSVFGHAVSIPCVSWQIYCEEGQSESFLHSATGGEFVAGHFANSQFLPVRLTYDPSGHCLASLVQAIGAGVGVGMGTGGVICRLNTK